MDAKNTNQSPKRICLGRVAAPHGVRGLVKLLPYGDDPSLFETTDTLYTSETGMDTMTIKLKNGLGKYILAEIEGCSDRNKSEELKGTELFVERDALPELEDDDGFYYEDLVGLKALGKEGDHIGKVIGVDDFGAGDLLEIQPLSGSSFYVPFNETYVLNTDIESGTVTVVPLEMD